MDTKLSPLDQIRQVEADVTRQIATAEEAMKQKIAQVRRDVKELVKQAREKGHLQGLAQGKQILSKTEEEAQAIVEQANRQAEVYRATAQQHMTAAVGYAVDLILGLERQNESK